MASVEGGARGYACTALIMAIGSSLGLPALIIEAAASDRDPREAVFPLAAMGLGGMASASEVPGRAAGWMVMARPGLEWVDVLSRSPDLQVFFSGKCVTSDGWVEAVKQSGRCVLIIGSIGLIDVPDGGADPMLATRMVDAAGAAGLAMSASVPVYLPGYLGTPKARVWPGRVAYRRLGSDKGIQRGPLGFSVTLDETDEFSEAADIVHAEARGMSYQWVRQRLAVELLLRGHFPPPRIVDRIAEDITFANPADRVRRAVNAVKAALATNWLAMRSIAALAFRRQLPHWHIFGIHTINTDAWEELLRVAIDPWADELLAVGESDEIGVWLGVPGETVRTADPNDIAVYRGDYRLGVLDGNDGAYRAILMEPRHADIHLLTDAVRSRADDGSWQLRVLSPWEGVKEGYRSMRAALDPR